MTTLPERLQDFADDYPVTCDLDRKAVALLLEAATALQSSGVEVGCRTPIAWVVETEHYGRGYSFSNEFIETFPNAPVSFGNLYLASPAQPSGFVLDDDVRDAARYRWLRNEAVMAASPHGEDGQMVWAVIGNGAYDVLPIELDELDAHIDAAMLTAAPAPIEQEG